MNAEVEANPSRPCHGQFALTPLAPAPTKPQIIPTSQKNRDRDNELPTLVPKLRELLKDDEKIVRKDDDFLAAFLRVRKYDVDRAATNVRDFYVNMERNQDLIQHIRPSQFISVYETNGIVLLREPAPNGSKICLVTIGAWDTARFKLRPVQQSLALTMLQLLLCDKGTQLHGLTLICDLQGLTLSHVAQLTPKELHRLIICVQGGSPVRLAAVHFINYPPIFWGLYFIVQRFLKAKLRRRIHYHNNLESLHKHFDGAALPESLGGSLPIKEAMDTEMLDRLLKEDKFAEEHYSIPVQ